MIKDNHITLSDKYLLPDDEQYDNILQTLSTKSLLLYLAIQTLHRDAARWEISKDEIAPLAQSLTQSRKWYAVYFMPIVTAGLIVENNNGTYTHKEYVRIFDGWLTISKARCKPRKRATKHRPEWLDTLTDEVEEIADDVVTVENLIPTPIEPETTTKPEFEYSNDEYITDVDMSNDIVNPFHTVEETETAYDANKLRDIETTNIEIPPPVTISQDVGAFDPLFEYESENITAPQPKTETLTVFKRKPIPEFRPKKKPSKISDIVKNRNISRAGR